MGKPQNGAWAWGDPESPNFPEDCYDVAKTALFQSPAKPRPDEDVTFRLLELHVIPVDNDLLAVDGGNQVPSKRDGACRVFIHAGDLSQMQDENSGTKECYYAPSSDDALRIYAHHYADFFAKFHKTKKFLSRWIGSPVYRKQALEKGIAEGPAISDEVTRLVEYLWREAMGKLTEIISVPYRKIGIGKVEKAEGILLRARKLLDHDGDADLDSRELDNLSDEFYKLIPHNSHHVCNLSTKRILAGKQELCQLIHDIVKVSEATDWSQRSSSQSRYRALQCYLECLEPDHPEYVSVESLVMSTSSRDEPLEIKRIFAASRGVEEAVFTREIGNDRLLFHASRPANFLGILSRGVLLPKIVVEVFGGSRRDAGMLGSGIYFGDRVSTAQQYSSDSQQTGTRLMVVNKVALGNIKDLYKFDLSLDEAPEGFQSTHGVSRTEDRQSEFKDDEYVVYEASQQCIRYLVEFTLPGDIEIDMLICATPAVVEEGVEEMIFCKQAQEESSALPSDIDLYDIECARDPLALIEAGLVSANEQSDTVTLQAVHIRAKVLDLVAQVVVLQSYRNNSSDAMEAKYVFPVDEAAAVCGFEAFINDKHVMGVVKEKEEAHRDYLTAVEKGHGAYLMDEEAPNVFSVSIGNLPARCDVLIKVTYVTELAVEGDRLAFNLLGTVAPWKRQEVLAKGLPGGGDAVDVELETIYKEESVQVSVTMPTTITCIESPTHSILVKQQGKEASIQLGKDSRLDEGMQLLIGLEDAHTPRMWLEEQPGEDEKAAMLVFYPDFEANALSKPEMVLVLDSSNSMKGEVLDEAKKLLLLMLANLPARCTFNVIFFGTEFDELFPTSQHKDKASLKAARDFIKDATAEQGCTDFWRPLQSHHLLKPKSALRNILLITDGHLSNEGATLRAVCRHRATSRVFTFGVSKTANRHLLAAVARAGGGAFEFFDSKAKSSWEKKIKLQVTRATQPAVTSISVSWEQSGPGGDGRRPPLQAPAQITTLFRRNRLLVYGLVADCQKATLSFEINGKKSELTLLAPQDQAMTGKILHKLAARAVIRNWEEGALHANRTEHESQKDELKARIVELSMKHSVVTAFTSFIAVEERDEEEQKQLAEGHPPVTAQSLSRLIENEDVDHLPSLQWNHPTASLHQPSPLEQLSTLLQTARVAEDSFSFKMAEKYYEKAYGFAKEKLSSSSQPLIRAAHSFSKFCVRVQNNMEKAYELVSSAFQVEPHPELPEETTVTEDTTNLDDLDALQQALDWAETCQLGIKMQPSEEAAAFKPQRAAAVDWEEVEAAMDRPETPPADYDRRLASADYDYLEAPQYRSSGDDEIYKLALEPMSPAAADVSESYVMTRRREATVDVLERKVYEPEPVLLTATCDRHEEIKRVSVAPLPDRVEAVQSDCYDPVPLELSYEDISPIPMVTLRERDEDVQCLQLKRTVPKREMDLLEQVYEQKPLFLAAASDPVPLELYEEIRPIPMASLEAPEPVLKLATPILEERKLAVKMPCAVQVERVPVPHKHKMQRKKKKGARASDRAETYGVEYEEVEEDAVPPMTVTATKDVPPSPVARPPTMGGASPPPPMATHPQDDSEDESAYELVMVTPTVGVPSPQVTRLPLPGGASPAPPMATHPQDHSEDESTYDLVMVTPTVGVPSPQVTRPPLPGGASPAPPMATHPQGHSEDESTYDLVMVTPTVGVPSPQVTRPPLPGGASPAPPMATHPQGHSEDESTYDLVMVTPTVGVPSPQVTRLPLPGGASPAPPMATHPQDHSEDESTYDLVMVTPTVGVPSPQVTRPPLPGGASPAPPMATHPQDHSEDESTYELVTVTATKDVPPSPVARPPTMGGASPPLPMAAHPQDDLEDDSAYELVMVTPTVDDSVESCEAEAVSDKTETWISDAIRLTGLQNVAGYWDFGPESHGIFGIDVIACRKLLRVEIGNAIEQQGAEVFIDDIWDLVVRLVATIVYCQELETWMSQEGLPPSDAAWVSEMLQKAREYIRESLPGLQETLQVDWDALGTGLLFLYRNSAAKHKDLLSMKFLPC